MENLAKWWKAATHCSSRSMRRCCVLLALKSAALFWIREKKNRRRFSITAHFAGVGAAWPGATTGSCPAHARRLQIRLLKKNEARSRMARSKIWDVRSIGVGNSALDLVWVQVASLDFQNIASNIVQEVTVQATNLSAYSLGIKHRAPLTWQSHI